MNMIPQPVRGETSPASGLAASIAVRGLTVTYNNGYTAVRDVSFNLDPGTICALVGVNGSGTSTIFKAIMGFVRPTAGEVRLCGRPGSAMSSPTCRRARRSTGIFPSWSRMSS